VQQRGVTTRRAGDADFAADDDRGSAMMTGTGFEAITPEQRVEFTERGILLIRGALTETQRTHLTDAVDRVYAEERDAGRLRPDGSLHLPGVLTRDRAFGEVLELPYVWGLTGWNRYAQQNHVNVMPPTAAGQATIGRQNASRPNSDSEFQYGDQRSAMLSLSVAYVLSDLSRSGRGAPLVHPGSHLSDAVEHAADPVEITANLGDCIIFDRRLQRTWSRNSSTVTRKLLFVGYTYRWIRPLDDMPII
jgi:hypothetical protein